MTRCPACGNENADSARFCSHCGRPLAQVRQPADEAERRLVTILFADITGSTPLGEELDPEDLKDVLGAYAEAMREEIEAEGGTVEKFIGDAVMAAFGVPVVHEDDATRAVRAALRMRARLERLNEELEERHGIRLAMRTGINTGEVVATTSARSDLGMVTGDAVNAAARLEQTAAPGQILVSERTARSARGFRFREIGQLAVKGKAQAIPTVELVDDEPAGQPAQQGRGVPGLRAPMVGRDHELELLRSLYGRLAASGRAQLVTVYGDPGIGKSRLTREFLAWAEEQPEPPALMKGRCLPYGESLTYWPLAEIVKAYTGVLHSDPHDTALAKIARLADGVLVRGSRPLASGRRARVHVRPRGRALRLRRARPATGPARGVRGVAGVLHRAGSAAPGDRGRRGHPLGRRRASRPARGARRPRRRGRSCFCARRGRTSCRRARRGAAASATSRRVFLEPLGHDDAVRLVEFLLTVEELPDSVRETMLQRAEGNPFFLEEIVRHLIDEGRIVREGDRWRRRADIGEIVIPDSVQGVLAARIDLLPPDERRVLRSAAVVGRVFWKGAGDEPARRRERAPRRARSATSRTASWCVSQVSSTLGGRAGVRLQARPHARRRVRDALAARPGAGSRCGRVVDRVVRRRAGAGVLRPPRAPLPRGVRGAARGPPRFA